MNPNEFEQLKTLIKDSQFISEVEVEFDNLESIADEYKKETGGDLYFGKSRTGDKLFFALAAFKAFQARKNKKVESDILEILRSARLKDRKTYWYTAIAGGILSLLKLWSLNSPSELLVFGIYSLGFALIGLAIYFYKQENSKRLDFLTKMVYREEEFYDSSGKITKKMKGGVIDENSVNIARSLFS